MYNDLTLLNDYLEIVIQFGFVTFFVISFPLAPLLAWFSNYAESRVDAIKLTTNTRRPIPKGTRDIGTWQYILQIMSVVAIITNTGMFPGNF